MRNRLTAILLIILHATLPQVSRAVPARPVVRTVQLANGESVDIRLIGDEHVHAWCTLDGTPLCQQTDGTWRVAPDADTSGLRQLWQEASFEANQRRLKRRSRHIGLPTTYTGTKRGLVLLVDFPDKKFSAQGTPDEFQEMFNRNGYNRNGHIGSVRDFFADQSYGALLIDFDVIGPVTMSREMAYYGSNVGLGGNDRNPHQMVAEACMLADRQVNFRNYDWDGDGEVEQVFVVYAGYGENSGAPATTIWPHESSLGRDGYWGNGQLTLDGVTIDTYACSCELAGNSGTTLNGIGTACHEFSHCLGLPDFYDISYTGGFGMGHWDLMCSGSYNGPQGRGEVPYGFSAYERWFAGWLAFTEIDQSGRIANIPNVGTVPVAYVIRNKLAPDEFFILENHQPGRWFSYASTATDSHGLMVTHVDYDETCWRENRVNNNNRHQRMSIVPAEAIYGDDALFPGLCQASQLNRTSHAKVGGVLYQPQPNSPSPLQFILNDIRETDGHVSLCVVNSDSIYPPAETILSQTGDTRCQVVWTPVPGAEAYDIELTRIVSRKPYKTTTEFIGNVATTSYTWTDISERNIRVRTRAMVRGLHSEWSPYTSLELTPTGICDTPSIGSSTETVTLSGTPASTNHHGIVIVRQGGKVRKTVRKRQ